MPDDVIICPRCQNRIPLSKALAGQIEDQVRQRFEAALKKRERELESAFEERLDSERKATAVKVKKELKAELGELSERLAQKQALLERAQRDELGFRQRQRELEDKQKTFDLDVARKVDERSKAIEKTTVERVAEEQRLKDREKEEQLVSLKRTIEDLRRKVEHGS